MPCLLQQPRKSLLKMLREHTGVPAYMKQPHREKGYEELQNGLAQEAISLLSLQKCQT